MIIESSEALALMDKIEAGTPKFCNPAPSRQDWEKLRKLLSTPRQPVMPNYGGAVASRK